MNELINVDDKKYKLEQLANELLDVVAKYIPHSSQQRQLEDFITDVRADFYTVVVLGEFKRGKSTFMNALIGNPLLPVDVTPTTATINALMWGDEPKLQVYHADESVSDLELSNENLQNYVASRDFDPGSVNYLKISLPHKLLKNNLVFIDTPGVGDINEQRVEVTYNFIPRADTVLFLLDATSPVKRTEYDFLTETLLKQGLERILFLVNFIDEVDEDEIDDILESVQRRLAPIVGNVNGRVLPISAQQALTGKQDGDKALIEESGIEKVEAVMNSYIQHGSRAEEKVTRFKTRLEQIVEGVERELATMIEMNRYSEQEMNEQLKIISDKLDQFDSTKENLLLYVDDRETEMKAMVGKSLKYFGDSLIEELLWSIDQYQSANIKEYVEIQIPAIVRKRLKQWTEQYISSIHSLFQQLDREIAVGLAAEFNAKVTKLDSSNRKGLLTSDQGGRLEISSDDISNTPVIAGLIAGGAGTVAMLLGGPLLLPILGMAGYPFLQKHLMEKKLDNVKQKLKPEMETRLQQVLMQFNYEIKEYVVSNVSAIRESAEQRYYELVSILEKQLKEQLTDHQTNKNEKGKQLRNLKTTIETLEKYKANLLDL